MMVRTLELLIGECTERLTLVDIGARYGAHERWLPLARIADIICFEPDREECARLEATRPTNVRYLPVGLSDIAGERDLFITYHPSCYSNLEPVSALHEHYPGLKRLQPMKKMTLPCRRLDDVLMELNVGPVAAMKLDAQGSELAIMRGGERFLSQCALVDIEVEFNQLYKGVPLFCDIDRFLRDRGFVLWRLDNLNHYPTEYLESSVSPVEVGGYPAQITAVQASNGQVFWANGHYVRAEYPRTGAEHMQLREAVVPAILAGAYGWWDLAFELIRKTGENDLLNRLRASLSSEGEAVLSASKANAEAAEQRTLRAEISATKETAEAAEQRALHAEAMLSACKASTSWRITSPLRALKTVLHG